MKRFPQIFCALFLLSCISGCKSDKRDIIVYDVKPFNKKVDDIEVVKNPKASKTYHTDSTFEYEYRTGESGSYQYHYDVTGKECPLYYVENPDEWERLLEDVDSEIASLNGKE